MRGGRWSIVGALIWAAAGCSCGDDPKAPGGDPADACADGACADADGCGGAEDCDAVEACVGKRCVPRVTCTAGDACPEGGRCSVVGRCIGPDECLAEEDCAGDTFCSTSRACISDGTCAADGDCADGKICTEQSVCIPGSDCGAEAFDADFVPNNLLIVLDRSCSMRKLIDGKSKWDIAVETINALTTAYTGNIRFGMSLFPDRQGTSCTQGTIAVPVGAGNEGAIQSLLTASQSTEDDNYPDGPCVTNIETAMGQAATDPALEAADRANYVMLVTDGAQANCGGQSDANTLAIIDDLYMTQGVASFIVGFGASVDKTALTSFANAGGVPRAGDPPYYQADNATELLAQLGTILEGIVSCEYAVEQTPEDLDDLYVFFNDVDQIPRDDAHANGWDYDAATQRITFYGAPCDRLKAHEVNDVDVVYGCPVPVIQ